MAKSGDDLQPHAPCIIAGISESFWLSLELVSVSMGDHALAVRLPGPSHIISLSDLSHFIRHYSGNSPASSSNHNNSPSMFPLVAAQQTMQDDLLMDKNKSQPHHQQDPTQVDPPPSTPTPSSEPSTSSSESESPTNGSSQAAPALTSSGSGGGGGSKDIGPMESPILPGLSFQQQPQESGGPLSSPSSSFGSTWSTGTTNAVDDSFFQGIPSVNGTMLFQNFPHHVNPVFGGTFSPQLGLGSQTPQHQQQAPQQPQQQQPPQPQQRRSPVSPNQGPFPQRNAYQTIINSTKGSSSTAPSSAWNNHQNAVWSTASNPWSGLQTGRDPRRAVGVGVGVGVGVPSPLNPISPMKKPYSSNVIAPPKFPRAGALTPKPWMEDSAFRTDNTNNILPFQVSARASSPSLCHRMACFGMSSTYMSSLNAYLECNLCIFPNVSKRVPPTPIHLPRNCLCATVPFS